MGLPEIRFCHMQKIGYWMNFPEIVLHHLPIRIKFTLTLLANLPA